VEESVSESAGIVKRNEFVLLNGFWAIAFTFTIPTEIITQLKFVVNDDIVDLSPVSPEMLNTPSLV
jgi:hypothetical protein